MFLAALLHSDGEILVGVPCFPPMLDAPRGLGARVITVPARCARLNPDVFGPSDVRFYDRLGDRRTVVAPGSWFGDSGYVIRIGLAYPPDDELEKGLVVISDALRR